MDLKTHKNLLQLWEYSFVMIARCWWRIIVVGIIFYVLSEIVNLLLREVVAFLAPTIIFGGGSKQGIILTLIGMFVIAFTIGQLFSCYFGSVFIHLLGKAADEKQPSISEAISHSFGTALPLFVVSFLGALVMLPGVLLAHWFPLLGIGLTLIVFFTLVIRWTYGVGYVVLQERGPLDSMAASWDLTRRHYGETIGLWAIIVGVAIVCSLFVVGGMVAMFSFSSISPESLRHLPLGLKLTLVTVASLIMNQQVAFILAVFINRDNEDNPRMTPQEMDNWIPPDLDLSELEANDNNPNPIPGPAIAPVSNIEHTLNAESAPNTVSRPNTSSPKTGTMDVIK